MAAQSTSEPSKSILSLPEKLKEALPEGFKCRIRHLRTQPKRCDPLFSSPPRQEPEKTWLSTHFLLVSIDVNSTNVTGNSSQSSHGIDDRRDVAVLALEILIYRTKALTTIFVSKADSTGYLPPRRPSPAKTISATFLQWLATSEQRKKPSRKLVISLFARAQSQYLFPGSAENSGKHVLDDRQLIKWWTRVLDPIFSSKTEAQESECQGYITVPGYEGQAGIRQFLPPSSAPLNSSQSQHWKAGHPLYELARQRDISETAPTRCLLPRFPDDPKARFMQDLDEEVGISAEDSTTKTTSSPSKRRNGQWNSVRNLDRFWEAMEFRQECSSGRVVGFLWLVMGGKNKDNHGNTLDISSANASDLGESQESAPGSDPIGETEDAPASTSAPAKRKRKHLSGPIIPRQPRLKGGSSNLSTSSSLNGLIEENGLAEVVLSSDGYSKAMQSLLHLDFANLDVAGQSTSKWASDVSSIAGIQADWSMEITGMARPEKVDGPTGSDGKLQVNDLGGMIKKKRKPDELTAGTASTDHQDGASGVEQRPAVNMLGGGLVRKKPKPATS